MTTSTQRGRRTLRTVDLTQLDLPGTMVERQDPTGRVYWAWNPTGNARDLTIRLYADFRDLKLDSYTLAPALRRLHNHVDGSSVEIRFDPIPMPTREELTEEGPE